MRSLEQIESAAALWVVRVDRGLTPAEQDQFHDWLAADPRHGEALAQQRAGWHRLDQLADWRPDHSRRPNRDLLAVGPPRWRRVVGLGVGAAAALAAAVVLAVFLRSPGSTSPAPPIALIQQHSLPDGSTALLNRGAEIKVNYTPGERRISLFRGEAHFAVAKDRDRPFRVEANGVSVQAVGTEFSVEVQGGAVRVLVTEGQVQVQAPFDSAGPSPAAGPATVAAGQRCDLVPRLHAAPVVSTVTTAEVQAAQAWHPRLLDFTDTELATILAEFNRHNYPYRITVADPDLAGLLLSASIRSDNLEGFLRLLEGGFAIGAERTGSTLRLRRIP
jgi:transmembrane sensor